MKPPPGLCEVLIADDEPAVCFCLKRLLEKSGYSVHIAPDGQAALECARKNQHRLQAIFLDVLMPRINGLAALEAIRNFATDVPCCLMTAHRFNETIRESIDRAGVVVLDKPFSVEAFQAALAKLLAPRDSLQTPFPSKDLATRRILVAVPPGMAPWADVIAGVSRFARSDPRWSMIIRSPADIGVTVDSSIAGVVAAIETRDFAEELRAWGGPVVGITPNSREIPGLPVVTYDPAAVGVMAAECLLGVGCRSFVFTSQFAELPCSDFESAFSERIRQARCEVCVAPPELFSPGSAATMGWLRLMPGPVGVFSVNDGLAFRIQEACRAAGLRVPDDVAILGMGDDEKICGAANPTLTSIQLPGTAIGYEAARVLDSLLDGKSLPPSPIFFPPKGIASRASTDLADGPDPELAVALRYLREHLASRIGVDDIVAATTVSRSTLERRFRAVLGRGPLAELLRVRIERASRLLSETEHTIEEIARLT